MRIARFEVRQGSHAAGHLVGRIAVVGLLGAAALVLLPARAFASGGLSSTILSIPAPGFVATPLGADNGPITQANVGQVMGSDNGASSALGQSLADGAVTAYIRSWSHQPVNGDAVVIAAFEFSDAPDETSFVHSLGAQLQDQAGDAPFAVATIPGAAGAEVHLTTAAGVPLTEFVVAFAKGDTAFQVVVASTSGDLTSADAVTVAGLQFANAPDTPAPGPGTTWHAVRVVPLVGLLVVIAIIVFGRLRKYPASLRGLPADGGPNWGPPSAVPAGPPGVPASPVGPAFAEERPKVSADQWP